MTGRVSRIAPSCTDITNNVNQLTLISALTLAFNTDALANPVIDQMHTAPYTHLAQKYYASLGQFVVFSQADAYRLRDGRPWKAGSSAHTETFSSYASTDVTGSTIRYTFAPAANNILFSNADYGDGNHLAWRKLSFAGPIVMDTAVGSTSGKFSGYTTV